MSKYREDLALNFINNFRNLPIEFVYSTDWFPLWIIRNYLEDNELKVAVIDLSSKVKGTLYTKYTENLKDEPYHERIARKQLGLSHATASNRLKKSLLFNFAQKLDMDTCFQCGEKIENIDEFSIEHKIPWRHSKNSVNLFFNLDNIAFSHLKCNTSASRGNPKYFSLYGKEK